MFLFPNPDVSGEDAKPKWLRFVESHCTRDTLTDIYHVNGDPMRWLQVAKSPDGPNGLMITMWDQPRRMWDGAGDEYQHKGYRASPPPLTDEQREALGLLFKLLRMTPAQPAAQPAGDPQI